ncbi:MAG: nucleotidyltransferase family protein [Candidatus Cloacimonetes bacterium]|nr:nucleotidyltransferase family protein [Candidatus Cloacimonadota bacterium]
MTDIIEKDKLTEFCRKNHIRKLSLFGSALRNELRSDSDIDLLVQFEQGFVPGLITFAGMENKLTSLVGRKVDLRTAKDLSIYFREKVINNSKVQYAAK